MSITSNTLEKSWWVLHLKLWLLCLILAPPSFMLRLADAKRGALIDLLSLIQNKAQALLKRLIRDKTRTMAKDSSLETLPKTNSVLDHLKQNAQSTVFLQLIREKSWLKINLVELLVLLHLQVRKSQTFQVSSNKQTKFLVSISPRVVDLQVIWNSVDGTSTVSPSQGPPTKTSSGLRLWKNLRAGQSQWVVSNSKTAPQWT